MNLFSAGYKLVFLPTRRMSGDAIFWVKENENGSHTITDKAFYPRLKNLLWAEVININNPSQVVSAESFRINEDDIRSRRELHEAGVIGY